MKHWKGVLRCQERSSLLHGKMSVCSHHLQLPAHPGTRTSLATAVTPYWLSQTPLERPESGQSLVYWASDVLGATLATAGRQLGMLLSYSFTAPQEVAASVATFTHLPCLPLPQCILQGGPLIAINGWWVSRKFHSEVRRVRPVRLLMLQRQQIPARPGGRLYPCQLSQQGPTVSQRPNLHS